MEPWDKQKSDKSWFEGPIWDKADETISVCTSLELQGEVRVEEDKLRSHHS